ncbi:unnamed protein product [Caenorhabditis brenneri]
MVPFRLLTFLFLLSNASKLVTGTGTGNRDQVPCEDGVKTFSTKKPITTVRPCRKFLSAVAYKRKNGWWCSAVSTFFFVTPKYYDDFRHSTSTSYRQLR